MRLRQRVSAISYKYLQLHRDLLRIYEGLKFNFVGGKWQNNFKYIIIISMCGGDNIHVLKL